jgi:hypothetical protein
MSTAIDDIKEKYKAIERLYDLPEWTKLLLELLAQIEENTRK